MKRQAQEPVEEQPGSEVKCGSVHMIVPLAEQGSILGVERRPDWTVETLKQTFKVMSAEAVQICQEALSDSLSDSGKMNRHSRH